MSYLIFLVMGLLSPLVAGNGATHPVTGALFAKYLSARNRGTSNGRMLGYGSAFLLGMTSHLVSDHYGNFEPRTGSREMVYFTVEGIAGIIVLAPQC